MSQLGPEQQSIAELSAWWIKQAETEIAKLAPKAVEYGAADLKVMGEAMLCLWSGQVPEAARGIVGIELAIAFYTLGKCARLFGAYEQGKLPSDDTWEDLAVYARMALHVREEGRWP